MEADISGHQRKVMRSSVRPARSAHGAAGIAVRAGRTLPFVVARGWNAPEGYYQEAFFIVAPDTGEVYYAAPPEIRLIWGLQSITDISTEVAEPIDLPPGPYKVVFALGGMKGGEADIEAFEIDARAA
jgi:hypothetical protein